MGILICGRKIRWHRPIRLNDLLRAIILGGFIFISFLPRSYAGEKNSADIEASPIYALALILGMQSVSGPIEHSNIKKKEVKQITSTTIDRRAPHIPQDLGQVSLAFINTRLPRPHMEE